MEGILASMEARWRTVAITAMAPIAWGANYPVTHHLLPADRPLLGAAARALPAALLLVAVTRTRPQGAWWWRSAVLGTLNVGAFFVLIYVASQRLPSGIAATLMAMSPAALMLLAWPMLGDRPTRRPLLGAVAGVAGVALLVLDGGGGIDPVGVGASVAAILMSSVGFVLGKRWGPPVPPLTFAAWQLTTGSVLLVPVALLVEGAPPSPDLPMAMGLLFGTVVATALAYGAWFHGLDRLPAGTVGLIGLLNPVTGAAVGIGVAGESFGSLQVAGALLVLGGIAAGVARRAPSSGPDLPTLVVIQVDEPEPAPGVRVELVTAGSAAAR